MARSSRSCLPPHRPDGGGRARCPQASPGTQRRGHSLCPFSGSSGGPGTHPRSTPSLGWLPSTPGGVRLGPPGQAAPRRPGTGFGGPRGAWHGRQPPAPRAGWVSIDPSSMDHRPANDRTQTHSGSSGGHSAGRGRGWHRAGGSSPFPCPASPGHSPSPPGIRPAKRSLHSNLLPISALEERAGGFEKTVPGHCAGLLGTAWCRRARHGAVGHRTVPSSMAWVRARHGVVPSGMARCCRAMRGSEPGTARCHQAWHGAIGHHVGQSQALHGAIRHGTVPSGIMWVRARHGMAPSGMARCHQASRGSEPGITQ